MNRKYPHACITQVQPIPYIFQTLRGGTVLDNLYFIENLISVLSSREIRRKEKNIGDEKICGIHQILEPSYQKMNIADW